MAKDETGTSRRDFIKQSAMTAAGLTVGLGSMNASVFAGARGANDRIRVGFIGLGNRGSQLMARFMANDDVEVAEGDIDTVGGLVFSRHGTVPSAGTEVVDETNRLRFTVDEMDERRIVSVTVRRDN